MDSEAIKRAAQHFLDSRRSGIPCALLPPDLQPRTAEDSYAIQDATLAALKQPIAGWKVGFDKAGVLMRAPMMQPCVYQTPVKLAAKARPRGGIEAEIAFRTIRPLPPRAAEYSHAEVADAVEAFAAVELLGSRFAEPAQASALDRLADFIINEGIVCAAPRRDWQSLDFLKLEVTLSVDGAEKARRVGSHPSGDPLKPAVALVNLLRTSAGVAAGQIMMTGSWTGATQIPQARSARIAFQEFAPVELEFLS